MALVPICINTDPRNDCPQTDCFWGQGGGQNLEQRLPQGNSNSQSISLRERGQPPHPAGGSPSRTTRFFILNVEKWVSFERSPPKRAKKSRQRAIAHLRSNLGGIELPWRLTYSPLRSPVSAANSSASSVAAFFVTLAQLFNIGIMFIIIIKAAGGHGALKASRSRLTLSITFKIGHRQYISGEFHGRQKMSRGLMIVHTQIHQKMHMATITGPCEDRQIRIVFTHHLGNLQRYLNIIDGQSQSPPPCRRDWRAEY